MFPHRIRLSRLDHIFLAWQLAESNLSAANRIHMNMPAMNPNLRILYDFDNYTYRSTVDKIQFNRGPDKFEIKVANDGSIHPSSDTLDRNASLDSSRVYHNAVGWSQLAISSLLWGLQSHSSGLTMWWDRSSTTSTENALTFASARPTQRETPFAF
jgi:hypothetical protein